MKKLTVIITVFFFGFTIAATVYSVSHYPGSLPAVTITAFREMDINGEHFDTAVPKNALQPDSGEMLYRLYSIQRKEGPWRYRYYVVQTSVICNDVWYYNTDLEYVPVVCLESVDGPVVEESEDELYAGEEVRLMPGGDL